MDGPRDRYPLAEAHSWVQRVQDGSVPGQHFSEAVACAFTLCVAEHLDAEQTRQGWAGETDGGHLKRQYRYFAGQLGMGVERFRLTYQGARWMTLPEVESVLKDPTVGADFARHLNRYLSEWDGVLRKDRKIGRQVRSGQVRVHPSGHRHPSMITQLGRAGHMEPDPQELKRLASRVQSELAQLDQMTERRRQLGYDISDQPDWRVLRAQAGTPRRAEAFGPPGRIRALGAGSLEDVIRDVLRAGKPMLSYQIKLAVNRRVAALQDARGLARESVTGDQVDACLARLKRRGEVKAPQRGQYLATPLLRERSD